MNGPTSSEAPDAVAVTDMQLATFSTSAGLLRRLGAACYDSLLLIAVLMIATIPFLPFLHGRVLVPQEVGWPLVYAYRVWLVAVSVVFFGFFWTRRGRTLGMQAWRLRVEDERGALLTWPLAVRRLIFVTAPWLPSLIVFAAAEQLGSRMLKSLGMALLLIGFASLATYRFDPCGRTWSDRHAKSRLVTLPKT
jgi:uncharacterized RDD family membrane protein YckC